MHRQARASYASRILIGPCAVHCGGRGGIRTLEAVLPPTRFPVARTRPGYATLPDWLSTIGDRPWISTRPHRLTDSPTSPRRRGWDSNPRWLITTPLFESGTFNHSDTSPTCEVYQRDPVTRNRNGAGDRKTARRSPGGES